LNPSEELISLIFFEGEYKIIGEKSNNLFHASLIFEKKNTSPPLSER
jgi:hypothetical protein